MYMQAQVSAEKPVINFSEEEVKRFAQVIALLITIDRRNQAKNNVKQESHQ